VVVRGGTARGVVLAGGEELYARTVVSGVDPRLTFLGLVGAEHLPAELCERMRHFKLRGSSGKVNLALDHLPEFTSRPGIGPHMHGDVAIAPSIEYLERAFDDAKYGEPSRRPYINVVIPSLSDPSVAPPGKHVMSCFVQYAPYHVNGGAETWPERRAAFGDTVLETLEEYMPGLTSAVLHRQVLTPWDLEQEFGLSEGNIFHGELSLDQLAFLRPAPGWAHYQTPVAGLWMCASGTHPGGGLMGAPGALAARAMLAEGSL
jgi:phytoene dehydrogenase-like protein